MAGLLLEAPESIDYSGVMILNPIIQSRYDELPPALPIRVLILDWIMETFLDPERQPNVIDLGCGGMTLTSRYRDKGFTVTGVDARTERLENADSDGITFIQQDVRETDLTGFEIISHLGLFYHMTLEDQLDMFNRIPKGTVTVLETQIYEPHTVTPKGKPRLTQAKDQGYWGAIWSEPGNHRPTASWDSDHSFWHAPKSLYRFFRRTGFKTAMPVEPRFMSMYASRGYYVLFK